MNFFIQISETVALLVPDFLGLSLIGAACFSLYCIANACGLTAATNMHSALGIAFALAYFVTVADNVINHFLTPTPLTIRTTSQSESQSDRCVHVRWATRARSMSNRMVR